MPADLTVKQHDTFPPLVANLRDANGAVDLSAATQVKFLASNQTVTISGLCTVTSAVNGEVTYNWATGDTGNTGIYNVEFEVTWTGGGIQTFPAGGFDDEGNPIEPYKTLEIVADLG
jgi:hypothetical protein